MTSKSKPSCPVCLDPFTPVIRQPITCAYCPHATCRQCTSQYLLSNLNDPHCMGCKREWNREFIDTHLTQTFRKGPLRQHRRKVLMDREKGRLPAMQIFVEAQVKLEEANKIISEAVKRRAYLKRLRNEIQIQYMTTETPEQILVRTRPLSKERKELKEKIYLAQIELDKAHRILHGKEKEVRQFIMKCPSEGTDPCRGFLSTAWKCGTCQKFFCADCHAEKAGHQDTNHVCNEEAKATASMIRQETKPCPKCGIRISKIDGCDQMWCVSCQTTFSWDSGQILLNTVVHNPHYYEYLRRTNNGAIPREAGDVPCGGLPNAYLFTRLVMDIPHLHASKKTEIIDILRCLSDIEYVRLPQFPLRQAANVNQEFDIKYLMKQMTEEEWGTALERTETSGERKKEIGLILQTLLHVGSEKLTQLQNSPRGPEQAKIAESILEELKRVRTYANKSLVEKGLQMGMIVPQITNWRFHNLSRPEMNRFKEAINMEEEQKVEQDEVIITSNVAPQQISIPTTNVATQENSDDEIVFVETEDGQVIEVTKQQAQEMFA